ncbi:MAG: SOS response-associated peptidase [Spirochaetes bacterium]|nr:SOS response-associated peptidase [Spirochaetota bacterium]
MCGRFAQTDSVAALAERYRIDEVVTDLPPSYNIAPGSIIASIVKTDGRRILTGLLWGIEPRWRKEGGAVRSLINARSETAHEKPTFRDAFQNGRCLIVASGFFEWGKEGTRKQPVYITLKSRGSFAMAGLYEPASEASEDSAGTCVILTTEANDVLRAVHNRMPVIIPQSLEDLWLDPAASVTEVSGLCIPYDSVDVQWHRVSAMVNSTSNNTPQCIASLK